MACIPGGPFLRGKDGEGANTHPQSEVWLQSYYVDIDEVTNAQYDACEAARKCDKAGPAYIDFNRPKQPVNGINWFNADKYCRAQGKHLPTEAQWEKAARGTDGRTYPWGEEEATCELAIIKVAEGRSCGVPKRGKKPETGRVWEVGSRAPNQYGLNDMAGNSFEWVADWYTSSYEACGEACSGTDPLGPCPGKETCKGHRRKGVRGGSWYWGPDRATTYFRRAHTPRNQPFHHFGFRCAASLEEGAAMASADASPDANPEG
jgi:formylglycine-generating enzyme required for sulfatase activity